MIATTLLALALTQTPTPRAITPCSRVQTMHTWLDKNGAWTYARLWTSRNQRTITIKQHIDNTIAHRETVSGEPVEQPFWIISQGDKRNGTHAYKLSITASGPNCKTITHTRSMTG